MTILVTGAKGMLGSELCRALGARAVGLSRVELDITDAAAVRDAVAAVRPTVIVNAAAYTDVDRAESEPEAAFAVNAAGAANVAREAGDAFVLHVSTDFVFDGTLGRPYREDDEPNPLCAYAASKLEGERQVRSIAPDRSAVARTAWVYGAGHRTFLSQILDLARAGEHLRVVTDQTGSPTWVRDLVGGVIQICERPVAGVYHLAGEGEASRYGFARSIVEAAGLDPSCVEGVRTDEMPPRPAPRPPYAPLTAPAFAAAGYRPLRPWREALAESIGDFL